MNNDKSEAPRTTLDTPTGRHATPEPAPGTTRDGAPGTTRDGAPGTTRDGAPGTTRDGRVPGQGPAFHRVNLPPALAARFRVERELGFGGEADVLLVSDLQTGAPSVVRLYRRQDLPLDEEKLDRLRRADRQHLIGLLDYGKGDGYVWEILEYAPGGTLEEMIAARTGPWSPPDVLQVFDQLSPAIAYANSLGMVHRDIKPGNVLVRDREPLDLVLADFGLTKFIAATQHMGTASRTSAYAPPEAISGQASRSWDWWSFGIVLVELLTGQNPFQRPDGGWQADAMIVAELTTHDIDLEAITDPRWKLLCRGLLTRAPEQRWGAQQTTMWRRGGTPAVVTAEAPRSRPGSGGTYVFGGRGFDDPVQLAAALRTDWNEGRRLLAGRALRSPQYLAFRDWLIRHEQIDAVRALDGGVDERPERGLLQVILALDPDTPPLYNGRRLDAEHLDDLAREAAGNTGPARDQLDLLYTEGILTICDGRPGCAGYALLDDRWHRTVEAAGNRLARLTLPVPVPPADLQGLRAQLLFASFEGQHGVFAEAAANAAQDQQARTQDWFRVLIGEQTAPATEAAQHAVIMLSAPIAARQTSDQIAAAEHQQIADEERRLFESRARLDRISVPVGVVCGILSICLTPMALVFGPIAVYCGVRARRTPSTGASTVAIALGAIGVIVFLLLLFTGNLGSLLNPTPAPTVG